MPTKKKSVKKKQAHQTVIKRQRAILFVLLFALVGVLVLWRTLAAPAPIIVNSTNLDPASVGVTTPTEASASAQGMNSKRGTQVVQITNDVTSTNAKAIFDLKLDPGTYGVCLTSRIALGKPSGTFTVKDYPVRAGVVLGSASITPSSAATYNQNSCFTIHHTKNTNGNTTVGFFIANTVPNSAMRVSSIALAEGATEPPPPPTCQSTDNSVNKSSLADYAAQPGDQVITIPDGPYAGGGTVNTTHPKTDGLCKGWLVLQAKDAGQVVVDLSRGGFTLDDSASRIAFVGIKFINGGVHISGNNMIFFYTMHDGSPGQKSKDPQLKDFYMNNNKTDNIHIYGGDLSDSCDGVTVTGSSNISLTGTLIHDLYDPPDVNGVFCHSDYVDNHGRLTNFSVSKSWIRGRLQLETGPFPGLNISDTWVSNSGGAGMQIFGDASAGKMNNVRFFSNHGQNIADSSFAGMSHTNVYCDDSTCSPHAAAPANQDTQNPATLWRNANPITSWEDFLY